MNLFAFELGRKRHLCFSELIALLGEKNLVEKNIDTAIFKLDLADPQALQSQLGGTIKIMEILDRPTPENLKPGIKKVLESQFRNHKGKVSFAVNALNFKRLRDINIKELLNFSKKILKSFRLNSRFVNKNFKSASSSATIPAMWAFELSLLVIGPLKSWDTFQSGTLPGWRVMRMGP